MKNILNRRVRYYRLMKHPLILLVLIALLNAVAIFAQDAPIRVMSFNIRLDNPADGFNSWENRKDLVINTLYSASCDIIGMQEVVKSQLDFLKEKMSGYGSMGVGRDDGRAGGEYVPVFYKNERFRLLDNGTFWLSPTPQDTGSVGWDAALTRICTWGKFHEWSSGLEFYFLNTHFDHMGKNARAESAKLILDFIQTSTQGFPVILTGDFNCTPDEEPYRLLTGSGTDLTDACKVAGTEEECLEGTFNGWENKKTTERIDMIFYSGDWQVNSYDLLKIKDGEMFVSDHWPVMVTVGGLRSAVSGQRSAVAGRRSPVGGQQSGCWVIGDTTFVQTFTFDSIVTRRALFDFPEKGKRYEKILMYYTLKCDSLTPHDQYPCGEWDYTTYTRVYHRNEDGPAEQFEIGRFITPYGKRLDLGLNGFTWVYDVTAYEPLLHGEVDLQAANGQELLDLKFLFIEGIPPRDVISVRNIWPEGSFAYKELADDEVMQATSLKLDAQAASFMLRARISGHGHFGPFNCCEWDPKMHTYIVNGEKEFDWKVWRDCGMNPVYPQGGTWQFDRAGWCPGTFVDTYDFEITPFVKPGETTTIDYKIQAYDPDNGEEGGNYEMAMHFFEFTAPNYHLDLELTDILAPGTRHEYRRMNPVSLNPVIRVRNRGADTVRTFTVAYGVQGSLQVKYEWNGKLGFMQFADIILPKPSWKGLSGNSRFEALIESVNGTPDELASNNSLVTAVGAPVILPGEFYVHVKTQGFGRAADNAYKISDKNGLVVSERLVYEDDSVYQDLVKLKPGAYDFTFTDKNEDGMIRHWWLRNEDPDKVGNNGELMILDAEKKEFLNLGFDFAEKITLQFFVGEPE